ncbi:MAG: transposase [Luminiphilus sp.]|nr:transposase [Luminiphilus sp.]
MLAISLQLLGQRLFVCFYGTCKFTHQRSFQKCFSQKAGYAINEWRQHDNEVRPHSSLGKLPPRQFVEQTA